MIWPTDSLTLAITKLKTRKIRLAVTIIISGLLFGGLAGASIVARGVFKSVDSFSQEGFGSRYIINGSPVETQAFYNNKQVNDRAVAIHKATIDRKKVEAKRLGITYDPSSDTSPVQEFETPFGKETTLDPMHQASILAIKEFYQASPPPGLNEFKNIADDYKLVNVYESKGVNAGSGTIKILKNGTESFEQSDQQNQFGPPTGLDTFMGSWSVMSNELMTPFILPNQTFDIGADGTLPIVIPYSAAEELLGLASLPENTKPYERLARIKEIREKASEIKFDICYRNSTSAELVNSAQATAIELEQNKNKKDYQRPSLQYGLPKTSCGSVETIRDVRTAEEKTLVARQEEFDRIFGKAAPEQAIVKFRVIGLSPSLSGQSSSTVSQIIYGLLTSYLGDGWFMPYGSASQNNTVSKLLAESGSSIFTPATYYGEFADAASAKKFIDEKNCQPDFMNMGQDESFNPFASCIEKGTLFNLMPFGGNSIALETAKEDFGDFFRIAAIVVAAIGAVIMMGTVGRMIADSRRETAVFRAIGAKKLDIAQIYVLYTVILSLLIFVFAVILGVVLASWLNQRYSEELTSHSLLAYNAQDLTREFKLFWINVKDLGYLGALTVAGGVVSSLLPLARNLRRNPIRDMRDEN